MIKISMRSSYLTGKARVSRFLLSQARISITVAFYAHYQLTVNRLPHNMYPDWC